MRTPHLCLRPWLSNLLQHATGVTPTVIGKPSEAYFKAAIQELGVSPEHVKAITYHCIPYIIIFVGFNDRG